MPSRWLNMGCGRDIRQAFVNADNKPLKGVQVVCDFSRFPWPFVDSAFDKVLAIHVFEHLPNTVRAMEELHRITAPGARTTIEVPHYKHSNAYKDPTHVRFFTEESFDYFGKDERSYYTTARFHVASVKKDYDYHIDKWVRRPFPRLLPWIERYFDHTVEKLTFTLVTMK
ncbi:MAG TPA: methyltransferase domain-containing protein [Thermoplasmata archaeon]